MINKATLIFLLSFVLLTATSAFNITSANSIEYIYVDPQNGNDNNPGSLGSPVLTVAAGQRLVRERISAGTNKDIVVYLRYGYHQISTPLQFNASDSRSNITVTYTAYPNERAALSGHTVLPPLWESQGNNVWRLNYHGYNSDEWSFGSLFFNGEMVERSRYPNQGYLRVADTNSSLRHITFTSDIPNFTPISTQAVFLNDWATSRSLVTNVRRDNKRDIVLATSAGFTDHPYNKAKKGGYGYFSNVPMELAGPRTWSYDEVNQSIYYKGKDGENPNSMHVVAPLASQLINIDGGSKSTPVENLHFVGINFEYSSGWFNPVDDYRGFQAGTFNTPLDGYARFKEFRSAIKIQNAKGIRFNNNRVAHVTGNGIHVGTGTESIQVFDNIFEDIGVSCIRIGDTYDIQNGHANYVSVKGNRVRRCGNIVPDAVGIWEGYSRNVSILSNTVSNLPYTGISVGWRWDATNTSQRNNTVNGNRIFNVMNTLADGGGIYTLGISPNTSIANNLIYNVKRSPYASGSENNAIFFDQNTTGVTATGNAAYSIEAINPFRYNMTGPEKNNVHSNYFGEIAKTVNLTAGTKVGVGTLYSQFQLGIISSEANASELKVNWGSVSGAQTYDVIISKFSADRNQYTQTIKKQTSTTSVNVGNLKSGKYAIEIKFKKDDVYSRKSAPVFYTIESTSNGLIVAKDQTEAPESVEEEALNE